MDNYLLTDHSCKSCPRPMSELSTSSAAWGKYDEETGAYHRLEHHCADVTACFEALIRNPVLHNRFSCAAGEEKFCTVNQSRLTVIAFLHDFSKLNAGFQFKVGLRRELLKTTRPDMRQGHIDEAFFFCRSRRMCETLGFHKLFEHWGEGFIELLIAALSHHGRPAHEPNSGDGPEELGTTK